ncbi:uncharacterized protein BP5553_04651 [Venustampulla echinocandica]|uniref:NAD(P)-binding protein n=1 Tax=Venustampulla echinocandica TaxID=2656787 RepID=A0A370TNX2_9HELO|nr:uncharacterized protein BP5553_04651 [Venustampulla echinocandica]RDL37218.1 hypothetical protein BP5553_04651 [Venustampulla echinocandica]
MATSNPVFKAGNTAVITGGASGIGLALASKCGAYGMNVIICDKNISNLKAATASIKGTGKIEGVEMDVSKVEDFVRVKGVVEAKFGGTISILALNAGTCPRNHSWTDPSYFQQTFAVNTLGITNGLATLLPLITTHSTATHPSSIIITGSKQGITNPPGNPAYNASKAAVKFLAEHLSFDLRKESPTTSVHLLIPGWTFTGLTGSDPFNGEKKEKPEGAWTPEQVVEFLEENMDMGAFYVMCPDNDVSEALDRKRILWGIGDLLKGRPPLTRWREDWMVEAEEWIALSTA